MKNENPTPQLPDKYKLIVEETFALIRDNHPLSKEHRVFAIGRTEDRFLMMSELGNELFDDVALATFLKNHIATFNADFYMYAEQIVADRRRYAQFVIETTEGRWVAHCDAKSFQRGKIKDFWSLEPTRDDDILVSPFEGLLYQSEMPSEDQSPVTDKLFGVGTLQKIYENQKLKNWVDLLEYEIPQALNRDSLNACALLLHNIYSELDALTGAGFKRLGNFDPTAIRSQSALKEMTAHYKTRAAQFESVYGIKCRDAHIILSDCFNDILLDFLSIEGQEVDESLRSTIERGVLEILQVVTDWDELEDPETYH